ncbi:MAG: hypothetical protein DKM50_04590 [Candidatus Margulisiibacteriota bacterium]|nr:MAG: hypothetical protein A2X42_12370 [Candidatus Margulisbacteria bacterium GWF2_38_17]OGI09583.1 MAG: hypothetical protein A2X41_06575 [Candidatus Margulisbacteria bacterium GWE2_39_32]PZM82029.1 MAG: hypothetical protein DKM50_04590 [Candidatus Margulisiibacteriota bacterium]HCY35850.1 hypothetical protein [Candidatus Margulisiibacteriota bacterium]
MSYLTWRLIFKPEIVIYSMLSMFCAFIFVWHKIGYISVYKSSLLLFYIILLIIINFLIHEMYFIKQDILKLNQSDNVKTKNKDKQKNESITTDEERKSKYILKVVMGICFLFTIMFLVIAKISFESISQSLTLSFLTFAYILFALPPYFVTKRHLLNEIITLAFWNSIGLWAVSCIVSNGIIYKQLVTLLLPIFFSGLLYATVRYGLLENKVYGSEFISEALTGSTKSTDKKNNETVLSSNSKFFSLDKNNYLLIMLFLIGLLFYSIIKCFFINYIVAGLSIFSLIWGINITKQVIFKDYEKIEHLSYLYRSTKIIFLWLNLSFIAGLIADVIIKYRLV